MTRVFPDPPPDWPIDAAYGSVATVLEIYPNAGWMPWETPPVNQQVRLENGQTGTVLDSAPTKPVPYHHCPTCTCTRTSSLNLWWLIELNGWWGTPERFQKTDQPRPGDRPLRVLEYPPRLEPVTNP